jgi:hypothetical protein
MSYHNFLQPFRTNILHKHPGVLGGGSFPILQTETWLALQIGKPMLSSRFAAR